MLVYHASILLVIAISAHEATGEGCLTSHLETMTAGETKLYEYNNRKATCECLYNGRYKCYVKTAQRNKGNCLFEDQYFIKGGHIAFTFTGRKYGCSKCYCYRDGTALCKVAFCMPVNGGYSEWSEWSPCSKEDCQYQLSRRTRTCTNPRPRHGGDKCNGRAITVRQCDIVDCQEGTFTEWSNWTSCSKSCGEGVKVRNRFCRGDRAKNKCIGESNQSQSCFEEQCPQISIDCTPTGIIVNIPNSIVNKLNSAGENEVSLFKTACDLPNVGTNKQMDAWLKDCNGLLFTQQNLTLLSDLLKSLNGPNTLSRPSITDQILFCALNPKRDTRTFTMLQTKQNNFTSTIKVYTRFDTYLQLTNENGDHLGSGDVLPVIPGQRVYFSVLTTANKTWAAADRCYVSTTSNDDSDLIYDLIKQGCKQDESVIFHGPDGNGQRYSFEAFTFIADRSLPLYVHCNVRICPSHIKDSFCTNPCPTNRYKRHGKSNGLFEGNIYVLKAALIH